MIYQTQIQTERFETFEFQMHTLVSLDATIDALCDHFQPKTPAEEKHVLSLAPYFGFVWPSSRALAQWILNHTGTPKKILELGCGLALPSFLATRLGHSVTATDFHPEVENFLRQNFESNTLRFEYFKHDMAVDLPPPLRGQFDWVIAADVLYESGHHSTLIPFAISALKKGGKIVVTDPGRGYLQSALTRFRELGFEARVEVFQSSETPGIIGSSGPKEVFLVEFSNDAAN